MNIITFGLRSILALWIGKTSIDVFAEGHLIQALAKLCVALMMGWPPLQMVYAQKKLAPIPLVSKIIENRPELFIIIRTVLGFILATGASNAIGRGDVLNGCGGVLMGLFLAAPLSRKVFDYPQPIPGLNVRWNKRMTSLVVIRTIGVFLVLDVLISLGDANHKAPRWLIIPGLALLFIRRIIPALFEPQKVQS